MFRSIVPRLGGWLAIVAAAGLVTGTVTAARAVTDAGARPGPAAQPDTAVVHGVWGKGQLVPGVAALNAGGDAAVTAISCAAPGYCAAGGYYASVANAPTPYSASKAFVVSEVKGRWGAAEQVPGTNLAGSGGAASITAISCAAPGNCVAGGYVGTTVTSGFFVQGFVVGEVNGTWGTARHLSSRQPGHVTAVTSVSCSKAGECLAGGYTLYPVNEGGGQIYDFGYEFVVEQRHGSWGGLRALTGLTLGYTTPASVACVSPGNCAAGVGASLGPVVAQETGGTWHSTALPGFSPGSVDASQGPTVVACPKAGACTAGGTYDDLRAPGGLAVWVASESGYRWAPGLELSGLPRGVWDTIVNAISCTAPGYCTLAAQVWSSTPGTTTAHGVTATETGGHWSSARLVVSGASGNVPSVSCPALGYCVAAVANTSYAPHVIDEAGGTWGKPLVLPGLPGPGLVNSVSCAKPGWCAAGGSYSIRGQNQAIVADETAS